MNSRDLVGEINLIICHSSNLFLTSTRAIFLVSSYSLTIHIKSSSLSSEFLSKYILLAPRSQTTKPGIYPLFDIANNSLDNSTAS